MPSGTVPIVLVFPGWHFCTTLKVRPQTWTAREIAMNWLDALQASFRGDSRMKLSPPVIVALSGFTAWRLNYIQNYPNILPYNCVVVIPLPDRKLLAVQMNAPSQAELDVEVASLSGLRFNR